MLAPVRMIVTYPLYLALEKAVFSSQPFEKTWSNLRPHLEKGVDLIASEIHPQGHNLLRRYVYQEQAIRRVMNECFKDMLSTEIMALVTEVQQARRGIEKRKKQILEWEKDLIIAPKKSWNPLDSTQSKLKEKITRAKNKNESEQEHIIELVEKVHHELEVRGVKLSQQQLTALIDTAEGQDIAAILSVADSVKQIFHRVESQLKEGGQSPELSKTYAGFYMMCNRLYLESIEQALTRINKVYMKRVTSIERQAQKQIIKAEESLMARDQTDVNKLTLENNIRINRQILEVVKFYVRHLNKRTKELLELRTKAKLNYDVALNTFLTMKIGSELATCIHQAEQDISKVFEFEPPTISALYDVGFKDQFLAVTKQIRNG